MFLPGIHLALSEDEATELLNLERECERITHVHAVLEPEYFEQQPEWKVESDRAWDAIHRVLTGREFSSGGNAGPLNQLVLGGESLCSEPDFILVLKTPEEVREVAQALPAVTERKFRQGYFALDPEGYGHPLSEDDFGYTWIWFTELREFWLRAAVAGRYVLFIAGE